jgi:hypothetical protein
MMDTVAYLINCTNVQDDAGVWSCNEERQEILASVGSISRSEWNSAGNTGLKPEIMVRTPSANYGGQMEIEVCGVRYGIYRTYTDTDDYTELYCERKAGVVNVGQEG